MDQSSLSSLQDVEALVQAGVDHHRSGRLEEAETHYRQALAADPRHWRAAHNLGTILLRRGQADAAVPLLAAATEYEPQGPQQSAWLAYAQALVAVRRFDTAQAVIVTRGADPRAGLAEVRLRQAWAAHLIADEELEAAKTELERALALDPENADTNADLGYVHMRLSDPEAATPFLRKAVEKSPDSVGARINLASALRLRGELDEAERHYRRALELEPGNPAAISNLSVVLGRTQRFDEGLALADYALAHGHREIAHLVRADAMASVGRDQEAIDAYSAALECRPDMPVAQFRRALLRLKHGDFKGGWADYEVRWQNPTFLAESAAMVLPRLIPHLNTTATAAEITGKRVLAVGEQGIGDQVMFASCLPDLARDAAKVVLVCEARLVRLFQSSLPQVEVKTPHGTRLDLADFGMTFAIASLGRIYRSELPQFPGTPYLRPRAQAVEAWAERLGPKDGRLRIGVSWRGGVRSTKGEQRSVGLEQLEPILQTPGCEFVSLQYGEVADEVGRFNEGRCDPLRLFPKAEIDDFEDLAALVMNLDLVVSVQNSLVHLCGALGQTCLTLIPADPEWRYLAEGPSLPWYQSVQLFRQTERGAWDPVIAAIAADLRMRSA